MRATRNTITFTMDDMMELAEKYTLRGAAKHHRISPTLFREKCRRLKIMIWPYRAFQAARSCLDSPHISVSNKSHVEKYLRSYKANPLRMKATPTWLLTLRKTMYKLRYYQTVYQPKQGVMGNQDYFEGIDENDVEVPSKDNEVEDEVASNWYLSIDNENEVEAEVSSKWYLSIDVSVTEFDEPFYLCWHPSNHGSC